MAPNPTAHVIVLGDISRSPRILSQAQFLAQNGWKVTMSGYGSNCFISEFVQLKVLTMPICPDLKKLYFPTFLALIFKFIFTALILLSHLILHCRSQLILLQNPPAVPTFLIIWIFIKITGKSLIIDWHNYGYTILGLSTSKKSLLTKIYYVLEVSFAAYFFNSNKSEFVAHLCVSKALRNDLEARNIHANVFYDRPADNFIPTKLDDAHSLFIKLGYEYPQLKDKSDSPRFTRFTEITVLPNDNGYIGPQWRPDRPALVVSSCSWTPDDDFTIMIDALDIYNEKAKESNSILPKILLAVTGRGPLRNHYKMIIDNRKWTHVEVIMPWLEWSDYPVFLGCADLGVSLHHSSSGLDLPMKVSQMNEQAFCHCFMIVDLLGVGVPVLALSYTTLHELLPENQYGFHFETAEQLASQMCHLLKPVTGSNTMSSRYLNVGSQDLITFRQKIEQRNKKLTRGIAYWNKIALPICQKVINIKKS